jgi:glycosyltransferase involved in cell wall biosynthesis
VTAGAPLRILIFDRGLDNPYSLGLATGLERVGMSVRIAGPNRFPPQPGDRPVIVAVYPREGVQGQKIAKAGDAIAGVRRLVRLVRTFRPDVLHFQWPGLPDYLIARTLKSTTDARLAMTVHNPVPRGGGGYVYQARMVRLADTLIVHGATLRDQLLETYHVPGEKVHVVPHGNFEHAAVRFERAEARRRLGLLEDEPVYTFFGQLVARKGLETLVDAFRIHCDRGGGGTLLIVGPSYGVDEGDLRGRTQAIPGRVRWMTRPDSVPAVEIDLAISAATQVVLPFHEATQSGSLLYAMTHGRCVVTTSVGEIPATVRDFGIVVPPRDPAALADALDLAASDPARCDEIGAAARLHVLEELDWARIASRTVAAYGFPARGSEHRDARSGAHS